MTERRAVARLRYPLIVFTAACGGVVGGGRGDWNFFVDLGRRMLDGAWFDIYATNQDGQTGPLTLVAAAVLSLTPRNGFVACVVICGGLGVASIHLLERRIARPRDETDRQLAILFGGVLLASWWAMLGAYGHLDDALVLLCSLGALEAHIRGRPLHAAVLIGLSTAIKPWGALFWPLALAMPASSATWRPRVADLRGPAVAAGVAAVVWLPFVATNPDSLRGLSPTVNVAYDSVLDLLGLRDLGASPWLRISQLVAASLVVLVTVARRRPEAAIAAGIGVRLLTDPGTWSYYSAGFVLGALVWDLRRTDRIVPIWALAASLAVAPTWLVPSETARALLRLAGGLVALWPVVWPVARARRRPTGTVQLVER